MMISPRCLLSARTLVLASTFVSATVCRASRKAEMLPPIQPMRRPPSLGSVKPDWLIEPVLDGVRNGAPAATPAAPNWPPFSVPGALKTSPGGRQALEVVELLAREQVEVDAELVGLVQVHLEDRRLDQHLPRPLVQLADHVDHLVDGRLVVDHDQRLGLRAGQAAGVVAAAGDADRRADRPRRRGPAATGTASGISAARPRPCSSGGRRDAPADAGSGRRSPRA